MWSYIHACTLKLRTPTDTKQSVNGQPAFMRHASSDIHHRGFTHLTFQHFPATIKYVSQPHSKAIYITTTAKLHFIYPTSASEDWPTYGESYSLSGHLTHNVTTLSHTITCAQVTFHLHSTSTTEPSNRMGYHQSPLQKLKPLVIAPVLPIKRQFIHENSLID